MPCRRCGSGAWWNGWRAIKREVVRDASGMVIEREARRHRARCRSGDRSCRDWTVYGDEAYPHRTFQLSVVSAAVEAVALGGATRTGTATQHRTTRRSVSRWLGWVGSLVEPGDLGALCTRLDPHGRRPPVGATVAPSQGSGSGERADAEYVKILHLAASTRESEVAEALAAIVAREERFDYAAVKQIVRPERPVVPVLKLRPPDLGVYDALLAGGQP